MNNNETKPNDTKVAKPWVVEIHGDAFYVMIENPRHTIRPAVSIPDYAQKWLPNIPKRKYKPGVFTVNFNSAPLALLPDCTPRAEADRWTAEWGFRHRPPSINAYHTLTAAVRRLVQAHRACDEPKLQWRIRNTDTNQIIPAEALGL